MNFFAHAFVALKVRDEPRFTLGAMLPDFEGMLGARVERIDDPRIQSGTELHHATDAAFHRAPALVAFCQDALNVLTEAGLSRGSARAIGHVGTELLIDGALSAELPAVNAYRIALQDGRLALDDGALVWVKAGSSAPIHDMLSRLVDAPIPESYRSPTFVAERLYRMLETRERLRFARSELGVVERWLETTAHQIAHKLPELLIETTRELAIPRA